MRLMRIGIINILLLFIFLPAVYCQTSAPDPHYRFIAGPSLLQDRNFYLFTLMERLPGLPALLEKDSTLQHVLLTCQERIAHPVSKVAPAEALLFSDNTIRDVTGALQHLLRQYPEQLTPLFREMRASGLFQLYAGKDDRELLEAAWKDAANGTNYIINGYTTGKGQRYPTIDSAAFYVEASAYKSAVQRLIGKAGEKNILFFQPSLRLALGLLTLNRREEAVRYEPLSALNAAAWKQIKKTDWSKYTYPAMVILGASPKSTERISEIGKNRCRMGADLYHKGQVPFIIVSGGHVRPVFTTFSEGVEMKKYLVEELKIPASAVLVDPYARHTTTNLRNAVRLAWRSGMPVDKRMLCVSDAMHLVYVNSPVFAQRCNTELGYVPVTDIQQTDLYFLSFMPDLRSLQANAMDPLDP